MLYVMIFQCLESLAEVSYDQGRMSHDHSQVLEVRLLKDTNKGLGINIADLPQPLGRKDGSKIVIESIVRDGPADIDGKLKRGVFVQASLIAQYKMHSLVCTCTCR